MINWMLWSTGFAALLCIAAFASERVAGAFGVARRHIWMVALVAAAVMPPLLATQTAATTEPSITLIEEFPTTPRSANNNPTTFVRSPIVRTDAPRRHASAAPADHTTANRVAIVLWAFASLMLAFVFARTMLTLRRDSTGWPEVEVGSYRALVAENAGPAVIGFAKPRIVLPQWALSLDEHARELMLLHEDEHIRTRDPRTLLIAGALLTLFPWNAALWLIVRQLRRAMEFDCDARVIRSIGNAREYGRVLLTVGERFTAPLPLAASLSAPRPLLEQRIDVMTTPRSPKPLRAALPFIALALVATTAATRAPRPEPLSSLAFAPAQTPVVQQAAPVRPKAAVPAVRAESSRSVSPTRTRIDSFGATHSITAPPPPPAIGRDRVLALARERFPAVARGEVPADFILMLFDDKDVFLYGFPGQGHVMIHVAGDTVRANIQRASRQTALLLYGASHLAEQAGRGGPQAASQASAARKFEGYIVGFGPWSSKGSIGMRDLKTSNTAAGLTEVSADSSGIAGIPASEVVHVDQYQLAAPQRVQPVQLLAVHVSDIGSDTGGQIQITVRGGQQSFDRNTGQVQEKKKPAKVKQLVILPVPVPLSVGRPYTMEACFSVTSNGDAKLLTWTLSKDSVYNRKIEETLKGYRFTPATLNGVAVPDTACVHSVAR